MGPLWDYNWAFGNVNYAEGGDLPGYRTDGWNRSFTANVNGWSPWWLRMEQDADWWQEFIDRWTTLREGTLASAAVNVQVDALTQPLAAEATGRHFTRWPQLGQFTVISPPGWETRTTYQSEVDYLKIWTQQRSAWMDSQFPPRPAFSPAPGGVSAGSSVTLTAAAGQTIHYTLTGADPRLPGGAVNPAALSVSSGGSVTINTSAIVTARAKNGTVWGAPRTGAYVTGTLPAAATLVVSEIHYHPSNPTAAELTSDPLLNDDDFEFIELRNVGASALDLTGAHFTEGVQFTFPAGTVLAAGAHLVVVEHLAAFTLRYGAGATIAGQYTGNFDNDADTVVLVSASGAELIRLRYDDDWTSAADGAGYSLTLRNPAAPPADDSAPAAWGLSAAAGGSPGSANGPVFTEDFTLPASGGQGTLIVMGNLTISGNNMWKGILLVGGQMTSNGNGTMSGATMSGLNTLLTSGQLITANSISSSPLVANPPNATANGTKTFQYNSCEVSKAAGGLASYSVYSNAWMDNFVTY